MHQWLAEFKAGERATTASTIHVVRYGRSLKSLTLLREDGSIQVRLQPLHAQWVETLKVPDYVQRISRSG